MKNVTTRPEGQGSFELLIDPVYGPNSKFFWPGSFADASDYVLSPVRISSYVSGEEFLEMYVESFSGVLDYRQSSDYPDESYCDTLYDHFYNLYSHVESWDTSTLFVSAVYRDLFHEMFPYQSQLLELRTRLDYESILRPFLEEGRDDEAMKAAYGRPFNEADKGERKLFLVTCCRLMKLILARNTDLSLISELVKVLHRTNIVARNHKKLKEGLLFMLRDTHALPFPGDEMRRDLYRKKLVLALSLFEIEPKAAEKAVNDGLSSQSHEPITHLIRDRPSKRGFAGDEASAYRLGPHYTATDYINDLVLSEKAYNRIFEEVRNSAAEWEVTSVLMSFEEEGSKIGQLAYLEMIRELFQENTDQGNTPLLSIVDSAAKSFDEDDLIASEEVPVTKKIFDKIGKKIDVPFKARKRIVEICNEQGIPKTEALAEKIISEVSSINKLSQKKSDSALEKFEQLVTTFCSLLALAVAILISRNSHRQFSIHAQSYQGPKMSIILDQNSPLTGIDVNETGGVRYRERRGGYRPEPVLQNTSTQVSTPIASLSSVHANRALGFSRRQERFKTQHQQESVVASAQKKGFDSQNPTFLTTEGDKKKFDDIYIRGGFNETKKEFTMEGSCGPIHRLDQLRTGPVNTIAKNMGCAVAPTELDHFLCRRVRQGIGQDFVRKADLNTAEAISPNIHKLLTKRGKSTYRLPPEGTISSEQFLQQVHNGRVEAFNSDEAQIVMKKEGRFKPENYIAWSERSLTWNRKLFRYTAKERGIGTDCVKSLLYPPQLFADAKDKIDQTRAHLCRVNSSSSEETQILLKETRNYVEERLSIMADFRDSSSAPKGSQQNIKTLADACNGLNDLANSLHSITGSRYLITPPVLNEDPFLKADTLKYHNQWTAKEANPEKSLYEEPAKLQSFLKKQNKVILTTNALVTGPMSDSMSESMKQLITAPLTGEDFL